MTTDETLIRWDYRGDGNHEGAYDGESLTVTEIGNGVTFVQLTPSGTDLADTKRLAQRLADAVRAHRAEQAPRAFEILAAHRDWQLVSVGDSGWSVVTAFTLDEIGVGGTPDAALFDAMLHDEQHRDHPSNKLDAATPCSVCGVWFTRKSDLEGHMCQ